MKDALKLYTIDADYVKYLSKINAHLYKDDKQRKRKYIGIVMQVNDLQYFVPLTSFKKKHKALSDSLDFLKIGNIAAININMMFPVPKGLYREVVIIEEKDSFYRRLNNETTVETCVLLVREQYKDSKTVSVKVDLDGVKDS